MTRQRAILVWAFLVSGGAFAALSVGTTLLAPVLGDPVGIVTGAGRHGGLRSSVALADLPLVIGVLAAAALGLCVTAAIRRRRPRLSRRLAAVAGLASVVVTVDIGVSLLAPELDPRPIAAIALGLLLPAGATYALAAEGIRRRPGSEPA